MQAPTTKKKVLGLAYLATERYIVSLQAGSETFKIFQILFNKKDGSLHLSFPYFIHKEGILSELFYPANTSPADLSFLPAGKVTTHRVKYSHHVSGEALFSQDGKIYSKIRKQSVPLRSQIGHIFTIHVSGIQSFEKAFQTKDQSQTNNRTVLTFEFPEIPYAVKFVGMWYSTRLLRKNSRGIKDDKPKATLLSPNGTRREGLLLIDPYLDDGEGFALVLYCDVSSKTVAKESLTFIGAFDAPEILYDHSKETRVLALIYPAVDAENLAKRIGSIDYR